MNKFIVTTTIHKPTNAIHRYRQMEGWTLIVIGDLKTPHDSYRDLENVIYLYPDDQEYRYTRLSHLIGWHTIQRRNIGFLVAIEMGADIVATVDDDNIPLDNWGKDIRLGKTVHNISSYAVDNQICFDPISVTNYPNLWHRGFPVQLLEKRQYTLAYEKTTFDIQANFWNGDPDVDAICRIMYRPVCEFNEEIFPFTTSVTFSPFNSQNTILTRNAIKDYFVFPQTGRMDDIWASYYMEALGYRVIYDVPTVKQDRNDHDLMEDFVKETNGYHLNLKLLQDLSISANNIEKYLTKDSYVAFIEYKRCMEKV